MTRWRVGLLLSVGVVGALLWSGRNPLAGRRVASPVALLAVPRARGAIELDGEAGEVAWRNAARTGTLRAADGTDGRPHAEARLTWSGDQLFVSLYAADRDIESPVSDADGPVWLGDHFLLSFRTAKDERTIDLSPRGVVTDARRRPGGAFDYAWQSGARVATDADGTLNDPSDEDEEWALEVALPLAALDLHGQAGERIGFSVRHCDRSGSSARACSSFGEGGTEQVLILQ
jgi:hypothetical protein